MSARADLFTGYQKKGLTKPRILIIFGHMNTLKRPEQQPAYNPTRGQPCPALLRANRELAAEKAEQQRVARELEKSRQAAMHPIRTKIKRVLRQNGLIALVVGVGVGMGEVALWEMPDETTQSDTIIGDVHQAEMLGGPDDDYELPADITEQMEAVLAAESQGESVAAAAECLPAEELQGEEAVCEE